MTIEIKRPSVVSIVAPYGVVSGGPEALHQLADALQSCGIEAFMVYLPERPGGYETPPSYAGYNVKVAQYVSDRPGDVVIVPETLTGVLRKYKNARTVVWWLSVDFYLQQVTLKERLKRLLRKSNMLRKSEINRHAHMAQSAYARDFLQKLGASSVPVVSDYLSDAVVRRAREHASNPRKNVVIYNPRKGLEITRKVMNFTGSKVTWLALQNMTPSQVVEALQQAKLYVDFGHHPGRDRIPREAALAGCCILVAERGSAAYEEDMPIPAKYKIDQRAIHDYGAVAGRVGNVLEHFAAMDADFSFYREWISGQKAAFLTQVAAEFRRA
jgi:hypothetical protein